jgi:hypothetical protein
VTIPVGSARKTLQICCLTIGLKSAEHSNPAPSDGRSSEIGTENPLISDLAVSKSVLSAVMQTPIKTSRISSDYE